jgi:hypothetical protein
LTPVSRPVVKLWLKLANGLTGNVNRWVDGFKLIGFQLSSKIVPLITIIGQGIYVDVKSGLKVVKYKDVMQRE